MFLAPWPHFSSTHCVLDIGLNDDRAVAVNLVVLVELDPALEIHGVRHLAFLDPRLHVHADHVLTNGQAGAGEGGADCETLPVVLCDVGGTDARDDPWVAKLQPAVMAETHFQIDGREDRLVAVGLDAVGADSGPHDVEVRVVDRVGLLAGGSDDAERLWVDHLVTAVRRLADLAHADASVDAGDTHSRSGDDRILGAVLGQGGGGGVGSGQGHLLSSVNLS
jgi:hypothetical protein